MQTNDHLNTAIHFNSAKLADQQRLFKQLDNIRYELPDVVLEVVVHQRAIRMLHKQGVSSTTLLAYLQLENVKFVACARALKTIGMTLDDLTPGVEVVGSALAHLITRQAQGWCYLKVG